MSLADYLHRHFVDKPAFAALVGIEVERLDRLVAIGAVPGPSYTCDGSSIRSAVFGVVPIDEDLAGEYFRPECARWAGIAARSAPGSERVAVLGQLESELHTALSSHIDDPVAVEEKVQGYLPHFWNGTFGLCVADPSSGAGIARKEVLQERLVALTANGSSPSPVGTSREELLRLIDDYADAAMPFSPAEYERSSRKRIVDDLRPVVAGKRIT